MPIKNRFAETHDAITSWRRDIHAHPELMFDTHRTSALVADKLRAFGCDEVVTGVGRTGVVGVIKGRKDSSGKVIGLRADMDALPMQEATGAPHASTVPGAMHACGHDGHTAMLLGAAEYIAQTRNFDGTAVVIFQPAEEGGAGGLVMCQDGLMERFGIQEVYGLHNWPGMPAGSFAIRPGPFFASTDEFEIQVRGCGSHAAKPHEGVDPVVMAAQLVTMIQTISSRNADPTEQLVVTVTSIESSSKAWNVIPDAVHLKGTIRSLTERMRDLAETRLRAICANLGAAMGGRIELRHDRNYPVMVNHPEQTEFVADVARSVAGACSEAPLVMGGEDFAYMLQERPGAYILLGNGDTAPVHNVEYDFDDAIIPMGCSWWAELVERRMPV
ncbi:amidohydrolase [Pelagivirga sediminicola]|uniref:Amidohydrolase n=1 Tax=Pelagivirga sediminicola TaxID=2170575 RepID=A0A2T7GBT5_9RHOB|nr:M20 aminoacylase family protein [Pelagivirga sediminicola]PVA11885.1 amidohydrolase [Pelagivirga sediminicola]